MEQLEGLHACYHKHWWCRLQMYLYFKRCHTFCNVVTLLILVISMIVARAWKDTFVMVALTAAATFVKGWSDFKKYPHKMDMCRFAYTTYEKTLIELRKDARVQDFDINTFLIKMQTLDELVTDFAPPAFDRYKQSYVMKFLK